ncbi:type II toxin-antitoxin system VapC family toxin [Leucobacter coleopterorum]|uniref:Ribonuclease VapC n=1 Tax=Leucobacter coleopterorum TaxID=2714933 RepID=A0ABX6K1G6_9MICO|nr:TA system VapC family ribonuclease toxin [Leucobacter coleopterorum]QIM18944.1 type II toxin-antitoxin system VapC family toxin [Leucobacter coleopterorum]
MIVLDVNVLVAAFREDHSHHTIARPWLLRALEVESAVIVPDLVWVGFLRIVTNRRIFSEPALPSEALAFMSALTKSSAYQQAPGLPNGHDVFRRAVESAGAQSNLIPDAYIAAVALAFVCPVATFDRDFHRFEGLRIVRPEVPT